jgi:hypothetical protein
MTMTGRVRRSSFALVIRLRVPAMSNEPDRSQSRGSVSPNSANPFEAPAEHQSPGLFWSRERWKLELQLLAGFVLVLFVGFITMTVTCGGFMAGMSAVGNNRLPAAIMLTATASSFVLSLAIPIWTMRRLWKAIKKSAEAARGRTLGEVEADVAGHGDTMEM